MKTISNHGKLYLLVDIDDFLVRSSDKIQKILNEKTNFKTDVLEMLEQLKRNCSYLVGEVRREIEKAQIEKREPDFSQFPLFEKNVEYKEPLEYVKYFYNAADDIYNQFLEEHDVFLEIDNLHKGERKYYNNEIIINQMIHYTKLINNNKEFFHQINKFCLNRVKDLSEQAPALNIDGTLHHPDYKELVSMDSNDIIKNRDKQDEDKITEEEKKAEREKILYNKPIENIQKCLDLENRLYDILYNFDVFNKSSEEIVDYDSIHCEDNVNWDAVELIKELMRSGQFAGVYFSTHHNGEREKKAKLALIRRLFPELDESHFLDQRFHDGEYAGRRRGRSSKIYKAFCKLGILPSRMLLLDDSKANCKDAIDNGAYAILFKPRTDAEEIKGILEETVYNRILDFKEKSKGIVYKVISEAYENLRSKVKKKVGV